MKEFNNRQHSISDGTLCVLLTSNKDKTNNIQHIFIIIICVYIYTHISLNTVFCALYNLPLYKMSLPRT